MASSSSQALALNCTDLEKHETCFYCQGYYGPCFGEPACATCHEFIHTEPERILCRPYVRNPNAGEDVEVLRRPENQDRGEPVPMERWRDVNGEFEDEPSSRWPSPPEENAVERRLALLTTPRLPFEGTFVTPELLGRVPPEIWSVIFGMLDDVSLQMASRVCKRWKEVIMDLYPNLKWFRFLWQRWPLFRPQHPIRDAYVTYSKLLDSVSCKLCFMDLAQNRWIPKRPVQSQSLRQSRLLKERTMLRDEHPAGILAVPLDNLRYNWLGRIDGPPDSVYQGGVFYLNLKLPRDYPYKPPMVRFLTKVLHPNISRHGDIGIDCFQHMWTPSLTIAQTLLSVQSLLTDPYLDCCMEPKVSDLYKNDREAFDKMAKMWTWKYAMHDARLH